LNIPRPVGVVQVAGRFEGDRWNPEDHAGVVNDAVGRHEVILVNTIKVSL